MKIRRYLYIEVRRFDVDSLGWAYVSRVKLMVRFGTCIWCKNDELFHV